MASTLVSNMIVPELFTPALRDAAGKKLVIDQSEFVQRGCVTINPNFPGVGANTIGTTIRLPRWDAMGGFVLNPEGSKATDTTVSQSSDVATVARASHAFRYSRQSNSVPGQEGEVYQNFALAQMVEARTYMNKAVVDVAAAAGIEYNQITTGATITTANMIDLRAKFGDQGSSLKNGALVVHSKQHADLQKLNAAVTGTAITRGADGIEMMGNTPLVVADTVPVSGTAGTVSPAGTTPPTVTITGTATRYLLGLKVECTLLGNRGTSKIRYSTDNGATWISDVTTAATIALNDSRESQLRKKVVPTGLTLAMADTAAAVDNVWTIPVVSTFTAIAMLPGAVTFWYNAAALEVLSTVDIYDDTYACASHLYYACSRNSKAFGYDGVGVALLKTL